MQSANEHQELLQQALAIIEPAVDSCEFKGAGAASFLSAHRGRRGFEIYRNESGGVTIDRSQDGDNLGEIDFDSWPDAVDAGLAWVSEDAEPAASSQASPGAFFVDLALYLSVMFLIREVYLPNAGFIANGLFWSSTTLVVATWRMKTRGIRWTELGLCEPKSYRTAVIATLSILGLTVATIVAFEILKDQLQLGLAPDTSDQSATDKFGNLQRNWLLFFSIIPFIWLESLLEEILDRGFLINWIERMFASALWATVLAVILQAMIFGFRHSYDLSERSITVGLIGLAMGIGYVVFGRNLWPPIIAHCVLNTISMLERVG